MLLLVGARANTFVGTSVLLLGNSCTFIFRLEGR